MSCFILSYLPKILFNIQASCLSRADQNAAGDITSEIAKYLMFSLNSEYNALKREGIQIEVEIAVRTIKIVEGILKLPKLYKETFINTQGVRYSEILLRGVGYSDLPRP